MKSIRTKSTSRSTMNVSPVVLRETKTTRLIFSPTWVENSSNPLRGVFRFQRKSPKDSWKDVEHKPLSSLKKDEGYQIMLDGKEIHTLLTNLRDISATLKEYGYQYGTSIFPVDEENVEGIFLQLGDVQNREWVIDKLKQIEREKFESLDTALLSARLGKVIKIFENNLSNNDESFWQKFFENNSWIIQQVFSFPVVYLNGETYLGGKNSKGRQGSGGVATDFLCMHGSSRSFAVVEIKTPGTKLLGSQYRGNQEETNTNTIYTVASELSGGIIQLENQIHTAVTEFERIARDYDEHDITSLNPMGVLIVGRYEELSQPQKKSFELFRKTMGKNQIITFDELLKKLQLMQDIYNN